METVISESELNEILENNNLVVTYFSGSECNVCKVIKPQVAELINNNYPDIKVIEIPSEQAPALIGKYTVFSVPLVIFWIEGREYLREIRNFSMGQFKDKIDKVLALYRS